MRALLNLFILISTGLLQASDDINPWSLFTEPVKSDPPQVHGTYQSGCLVGGSTLEAKGNGFETVNRHRVRYFGHPDLVNLILDLSEWVNTDLGSKIIVGDLGQAAGGPANSGHASHQIGLDADIRLMLLDSDDIVEDNENNIETPCMVQYSKTMENNKEVYSVKFLEDNWNPKMTQILERVALEPKVQRIFLNAPIKKYLCQQFVTVDADIKTDKTYVTDLEKYMTSTKKVKSAFVFPKWLEKIRPESGHAYHFHIRLFCPEGDTTCVPQSAIPVDGTDASGVGCTGTNFNNWFSKATMKSEFKNPESGAPEDPTPKPPSTYWKTVTSSKKFPKFCKDLTKDML